MRPVCGTALSTLRRPPIDTFNWYVYISKYTGGVGDLKILSLQRGGYTDDAVTIFGQLKVAGHTYLHECVLLRRKDYPEKMVIGETFKASGLRWTDADGWKYDRLYKPERKFKQRTKYLLILRDGYEATAVSAAVLADIKRDKVFGTILATYPMTVAEIRRSRIRIVNDQEHFDLRDRFQGRVSKFPLKLPLHNSIASTKQPHQYTIRPLQKALQSIGKGWGDIELQLHTRGYWQAVVNGGGSSAKFYRLHPRTVAAVKRRVEESGSK